MKEHILKLKPDIYIEKRGNDLLLMDPETGDWIIVNSKWSDILEFLKKETTFEKLFTQFCEKFSDDEITVFSDLIYKKHLLIKNGFVRPIIERNGDINQLQKYPNYFIIFTSNYCNMTCRYCSYNAQQKGELISEKTIKKIISKAMDLPARKMTIAFHGGEPMLALGQIIEAHKFSETLKKEKNKLVVYRFQTNGTLVTPENIELLKKHGLDLGISLDGPKDVHDKYRTMADNSGSFKLIWNNIMTCKKMDYKIAVLSTIHDPKDFSRSVRFFLENEIYYFRVQPSCYFSGRAEDLSFKKRKMADFADEFMKSCDYVLEYDKKYPRKISFDPLNEVLYNITHLDRGNRACSRSPCGSGSIVLCIDAKGDIYPCDVFANYPEMRLGSINEVDSLADLLDASEVLKELRGRTIDNIETCKKCAWRTYCSAGCSGRAYATKKRFLSKNPLCEFTRLIYREMIWKYYKDPSIMHYILNQELFRSDY